MADCNKCVLFTGQSGIGIRQALENVEKYSKLQKSDYSIHTLNLLKDFMFKAHFRHFPNAKEDWQSRAAPMKVQNLLSQPKPYLRRIWRESFDIMIQDCTKRLEEEKKEDLNGIIIAPKHIFFLSMHAIYYNTRSQEFFSCVDIQYLKAKLKNCNLKPTKVITFIDDIYDIYRRLTAKDQLYAETWEEIKESNSAKLQKSVESIRQLLQTLNWRAQEISHSEQIAAQLEIPHFVLAVKHHSSIAYDLIFSQKHPVYISHPISTPRKLLGGSEDEQLIARDFIKEIERLNDELMRSSCFIPFSPTTIDEFIIKKRGNLVIDYIPQLIERWPYGDERDLLFEHPDNDIDNPLDSCAEEISIADESYINTVSPLLYILEREIRKQLNSRDRKLVEQSEAVIVYRPYFRGVVSGGVIDEIEHLSSLAVSEVISSDNKGVFVLILPQDYAYLRLVKCIEEMAQNVSSEKDVITLNNLKNNSLESNEDLLLLFSNRPRWDELRSFIVKRTNIKLKAEYVASALAGDEGFRRREQIDRQWREICEKALYYNPIEVYENIKNVIIQENLSPMQFVKILEEKFSK